MFLRVLGTEWLKLRKSIIWLPLLIVPVLIFGGGILIGIRQGESRSIEWINLWAFSVTIYGLLLLPLLIGVFTSLICRAEHLSGGWKQLYALPVSKSSWFGAKFMFVVMIIALEQLLTLGSVLLSGLVMGIHGNVPWIVLLQSIALGWLASLPLAALLLWLSAAWKNFGAPFAVNVILTIPSIPVAHTTTYGPWYPWGQPYRAMLRPLLAQMESSMNTSYDDTTMLISGVIFFIGCWSYFAKRNVHA